VFQNLMGERDATGQVRLPGATAKLATPDHRCRKRVARRAVSSSREHRREDRGSRARRLHECPLDVPGADRVGALPIY